MFWASEMCVKKDHLPKLNLTGLKLPERPSMEGNRDLGRLMFAKNFKGLIWSDSLSFQASTNLGLERRVKRVRQAELSFFLIFLRPGTGSLRNALRGRIVLPLAPNASVMSKNLFRQGATVVRELRSVKCREANFIRREMSAGATSLTA